MFDKIIDLFISLFNDFKPIVFIMQYEEAVVFRGGPFLKVMKPGWHFRLPFVDTIQADNVKNMTICIREVNITTADNKTISIAAKFNCEIYDIYKAKVLTNGWQGNIVDVGRGIMSEDLGTYQCQEIFNGRAVIDVGDKITKRGEEMGLRIFDFKFTDKLEIIGLKLFNA